MSEVLNLIHASLSPIAVSSLKMQGILIMAFLDYIYFGSKSFLSKVLLLLMCMLLSVALYG